ncbi:hypothetical protein [Mucilaginibacter sp.]
MNPLLIKHIIVYLDHKYQNFFEPAQKSTIDYININEHGLVTFKHDIVLDKKIYEEMKRLFEVIS